MHITAGIEHRRAIAAAEGGSTDARLHYAIERQFRVGQDRAALVLYLSRLQAPAPRPHHRRIARAMLNDAAQNHAGEVFARGSGDLVLLCDPAGAAGLLDSLARLFSADAPASDRLLSLWTLPQDSSLLEAYLGRTAVSPAPLEEPDAASASIGALDALIGTTHLSDLIRRQTAIHLTPAGMGVLYRELSFSVPALNARMHDGVPVDADPYLFRHLAARLDARMIDLVGHELGGHQTLTPRPTLHLNLTLHAILSPAFLRLADIVRAAPAQIGVEIALVEAYADPLKFAAARMVLRAHGFTVVLDAASYSALLIARPEALDPDLVKLDWTPRMAALEEPEQDLLAAAIQRLGPQRIVLHRTETEEAVAWGIAHGIARFQGRHVDAILAASRIAVCAHATGCTLRQCIERAAATGTAGRSGCRDTALLDSVTLDIAALAA
jgi:EAL domain-containing protein (putative c-di-GMP-specific phosphodiesterase class I)